MSSPENSAESRQVAKPPCRECGGIGFYQTEGPGEGGVVLMNCHVCGDGQIIPDYQPEHVDDHHI